MGLTPEALLVLAVLGLYIYDSSLLLYCNEAIFSPSGTSDWGVTFGSGNMGLRGKTLYIPNPLLIHRPTFRLSWSFERINNVEQGDIPKFSFLPLAPMLWSIAVGLFVLLPMGFFTRLGDRALLPALLLVFGGILLALAWIWANREALDLPPRRFFGLAFESIVCPPFALNLVRHLSLRMVVKEDAVNAACRLQSRDLWNQTRIIFLARFDSEIELEEADSDRHKRLLERRSNLPGGSNE